MNLEEMQDFYNGRKVLITGHTGFKGSWMCVALNMLGADITGYALSASEVTNPALFEIADVAERMNSVVGDIRDLDRLKVIFDKVQPEVVIHMVAQPLVRESYANPVLTYETNVMGTVNVLECCRMSDSVKSVVNVTTDKVYRNEERAEGYREDEYLDGFDPYSNSKSCSELVTSSYKKSFFGDGRVAISTCRAGNVIGGGDFAKDRIIPDAIRAFSENEPLIVRNPFSTRPYQHVLEPVFAYLYLAMLQFNDSSYQGNYNIGPDDEDCVTTGELADKICEKWGSGASWINKYDGGPHEAQFLKLDCTKAHTILDWKPRWHIDEAISRIVEFEKIRLNGADSEVIRNVMTKQIREYLGVTE